MTAKQTPLEMAEECWGHAMPDWVRALAKQCSREGATQRSVAEKLDRAPAVVNQILRNKYPAKMDRIEERVRGVFMDGRIECPAMQTIPVHECQDWRDKAGVFNAGSPLRLRMYRACRACPRHIGDDQ